jgi:hypothetical protein
MGNKRSNFGQNQNTNPNTNPMSQCPVVISKNAADRLEEARDLSWWRLSGPEYTHQIEGKSWEIIREALEFFHEERLLKTQDQSATVSMQTGQDLADCVTDAVFKSEHISVIADGCRTDERDKHIIKGIVVEALARFNAEKEGEG